MPILLSYYYYYIPPRTIWRADLPASAPGYPFLAWFPVTKKLLGSKHHSGTMKNGYLVGTRGYHGIGPIFVVTHNNDDVTIMLLLLLFRVRVS